jgi:hypothetical protein
VSQYTVFVDHSLFLSRLVGWVGDYGCPLMYVQQPLSSAHMHTSNEREHVEAKQTNKRSFFVWKQCLLDPKIGQCYVMLRYVTAYHKNNNVTIIMQIV